MLWLFMSLCVVSCGDKSEEPQDTSVRLSSYYVNFQSSGGSRTIYLESDGSISSVYPSAGWIYVTELSNSVTITTGTNNSTAERSGNVMVYNEYGNYATIDVTQLGSNNSSGGNDYPNGGNDNPNGGNDNPNGGNNNPGGNGGGTIQKPAAPTGVSVSNEGNKYIPDVRVRWNSVSDATSYYIYKCSTANGSYSKIGETSYAQYGYSDTNAPTNGASAYYKVKAVNSAGESAFSSYAKYTSPNNDTSFAPATPNVKTSGTSSITVSWTCETGSNYGKAKSYEVYKRNPNTSEFELMTTTSSTSWSDRNTHPGINRYGVIAVNDAGKSSMGLGASNEVPLSRPTSFSASKSGSDVKFTWSKVSGATGYQIFESSSANGTYFILDQIDDGSTTTHTRYYPAQGTTKYFKIRAVYSAAYSGSPVYSDYSSYKSVTF